MKYIKISALLIIPFVCGYFLAAWRMWNIGSIESYNIGYESGYHCGMGDAVAGYESGGLVSIDPKTGKGKVYKKDQNNAD